MKLHASVRYVPGSLIRLQKIQTHQSDCPKFYWGQFNRNISKTCIPLEFYSLLYLDKFRLGTCSPLKKIKKEKE